MIYCDNKDCDLSTVDLKDKKRRICLASPNAVLFRFSKDVRGGILCCANYKRRAEVKKDGNC